MNNSVKVTVFALLYGAMLYAIYRLDNSDLLLMFLTFSLMIPIIYLIQDRYKQRQKIADLQQQTLRSELNLLKSQINPHFFFNTLNNLYGLAVEKSDLTQEVIYKLSQMMRFTIYDGRKDTVSVSDEVEYLQNFIELNQIRYQNNLDIRFEQNIENNDQRIPPLLFINLLENAFKHGVDSQTESQYIHFSLNTSASKIQFELTNSFDAQIVLANKKSRGIGAKQAGGLGTENLKRRLELLFPNKHQYTSEEIGNRYETQVTIDLT